MLTPKDLVSDVDGRAVVDIDRALATFDDPEWARIGFLHDAMDLWPYLDSHHSGHLPGLKAVALDCSQDIHKRDWALVAFAVIAEDRREIGALIRATAGVKGLWVARQILRLQLAMHGRVTYQGRGLA